jgi:CRISPR/Cas system CMR-associated protein Cmr5 small subunit
MLVYFVKAAQKIANQPGMVLYGNPPRWHQFNPAVHTDQDQLHYHAKKATEIKAAKELASEHAGADQQPEDHVAALQAKAKAIQDKASASAAVTGWKQALMAGKAPTISQAKAYHALAQSQPDKAAKLLEGVLDVIGKDKYEELMGEMATKLVEASKAKPKAEAKPETKPEAQPEAKPEAKSKPQPEAKPDKPAASVQQAIGQAYAVGTGTNIPKDGMGLVQCHFATQAVAKAIDDKKIALPPGTPVKVLEYDEDQQQAFNAAFAKTPKPEGLTSEAAKNLLVDLADKSVNGHSLLKIGDQFVDPHLKSGGASQAEINKVGAFFEKVYAEAAKVKAAPQADAKPKPQHAATKGKTYDQVKAEFQAFQDALDEDENYSTLDDLPDELANDPEKAAMAALAAFSSGAFTEINEDPDHFASKALLGLINSMQPDKSQAPLHRVVAFESKKEQAQFVASLASDKTKPGVQTRTLSSWTHTDPSAPGQTGMNNIALDLAGQFGSYQVFMTLVDQKSARDISFIYGEHMKPGTEQALPKGTRYEVVSSETKGKDVHVKLREVQDGDTKTINGVTYILKDGRWHRATPEEGDAKSAAQSQPTDKPASPALQQLLDNPPKVKKVVLHAVADLTKAAKEGNQDAFDKRIAKAKASVFVINGASATKLFQWADKVRAAAWPDAAETKPGNAESTKDAALQAAIDHLEEDKGQADIPPAEQKEDAALVAKLKEAVTAPADQQAPPKPKVVVTKPKAAQEPLAAPKPAQAQDTKRVTTSKSVLAAKLDAMKLPITNTNAKAVNGKIAKLEALVQAGDVAGLKAEKFGSNNYQKKLAKFAAEASALLEKAHQAKAGATQADDDNDWLTQLFGPQATTAETTVTVNGQALKKTPSGWDGPNNQSYGLGSPVAMVASLLATGTVDTLMATASAKEQAVDLAIKHGVDPLKALNKIAADKDGLSNPYDGDTKTINGVTYQLEGGRWHRVSPKDDDGVTQAMKDAVMNSLFDTHKSVQELQMDWVFALANGSKPTKHESGAYEFASAIQQNELVAAAVSQYLDKVTAYGMVKLNKEAHAAGAPHVWAYVADQLLAKHNETLKDYAQANAAPATAPEKAKTVTLYGEVFTHQNGAWYDENGEGISEFSPVFLALEALSGQGPDPAWLKHFPETTVSVVAHDLYKEGADPVQVMNALFPKGQANLVSGDSYSEGALYTLGLVDMVLKNGKWEVKQDDAPTIAANQPGPQADPVTAGQVDDPDFPGWYAAMLAGKTPTKPQIAAFAQALKDNTSAALWAQQNLENILGKAAYDLQIKPHFVDLYSKAEKADVLQDWVSSIAHGKAPTIKQALFYDSLSQDEQESLAYQALQDWVADPDDDDAVDRAMDHLMHLQSLGLNGSAVKTGSGEAAATGAAPKQPKSQVTLDNQTFAKAPDGSWKDPAGQYIQTYATKHLALEVLAGVKMPVQEIKAWSLPSKMTALEWVTDDGNNMDGAEALNALFPPNSFHHNQNWPQEGDTKTINGITYILQNGRWHRVTPTDAGNPDLTGADPNEVSAAGYTAALLAQQVPTPAQHKAWLKVIEDAVDAGQNITQMVKEHHDLVNGAIGEQKHLQLLAALHQNPNLASPPPQAAPADTSWHSKVHDYLDHLVLAKIAPTNTNFKTVKAKVEKYKKLLDAGKYAEILDTNWGSNNYAKKIANAHGIIKQHANMPAATSAAPGPTVTPTVVLTQPIAATPDESESWAFDNSQQMGSNHGGLYTDKNGQKWYVKIPKSEAHARNELLAAKLYEAAGVAVPNLKLVKSGGKVAIASQWQDGMTKVGSGIKTATGALEGFAVDAWLANYDSVGTGYDNLLKDANGNAVRIDVGGSLLFRAQGAPKTDFGDQVNELQGMLDPNKNSYSAAVFGGITDAQLKAGAAKVAAITPEQIKQLVQQYGPGTAAEKASLADRLIKRREDLLKKHPVAAAPKTATAPAAPVFRVPTPPDFKNWNGPGQGLSSKAAYNEQNQQLAEAIYQKGLEGDVAAVESMTYQPITETGAPAGTPQSIKSHPSKHIPAYLKDVIEGMTKPYVSLSAQMAQVMTNVADDFKDLVKHFPGVKHLKDAAVKIGRYAVVGKTDAAAFLAKWKKPKTVSKKQGTLSDQSLFDQSQANFKKLSAVEQQAIKDYTGSGYTAMNNALIAGKKHDKAFNCIKGLEKASVPIPAGAVISRYCEFDKAEDGTESLENHKKAMNTLLKAGEGAILQEFGIISTSTNSTTWSGRVHLKITVGEGVKGIYVANNPKGGHPPAISLHPGENEIMLPYGTQFMVTKIHDDGHKFSDATGSWGGNGATRVIEMLALPNADINMLSN